MRPRPRAGRSRREALRVLGALGFVLGLVLAQGCGAAQAKPPEPFADAAFAQAQAEGAPILVEITAPWCPACAAQRPIVERLAAPDGRFPDLRVFAIDFDTQKELTRRFRAAMQSTLIVFKGDLEVARSIGETQPEWIEALIDRAY